jgi:hypothetical protein
MRAEPGVDRLSLREGLTHDTARKHFDMRKSSLETYIDKRKKKEE